MKLIILFISVSLLISCASSTLKDPKTLKDIQRVKVYESVSVNEYQILKKVEGISCGKTWWDQSSKDEALNFLKAKVVELKSEFDGITNLVCQETGWSWRYNCNNSFTCFGDIFVFNQN